MTYRSLTPLLPTLVVHPHLAYRHGPRTFPTATTDRILKPVLHVLGEDENDRRLMRLVIQTNRDLGGGPDNAWFGIAREHFRNDDTARLNALADRDLLVREIGVTDENSHELRTVYFLHPRIVDAFVESLPPSM